MKLRELIDGVEVTSVRADLSMEIHGVTADSRQVANGGLFVAIAGMVVDGAQYVEQAFERGAGCVVSERALGPEVPHVQVHDARAALSVIAANWHGRPASKLRLIGVTGTSGKTTVTKMIESILDATGTPAGLIGTIEYRAGSVREIADRTTPDSIVLQQWFARMVAENVRYGVMEVSSHALALHRTHGVRFAAAVFTNLSRDHFDFHKDFEDYFAAKRMLFDQIDRSAKTAVVNADDEYGQRLLGELGAAAWSFGRSEAADIHPEPSFEISIRGLRGTLVTPAGPIRIESPLIGAPNLSNWMAAIGAALAVGIEPAVIEAGVRNLPSVRGRFERVETGDDRALLVDYAHKPDALEKLLHAVRDLAPGRKVIVVFGCGGDRDAGKRPLMGGIAAKLADRTIITSDNPRSEDPLSIVRQVEEGYRAEGGTDCETVVDRRAAIERAVELATGETVVVVAGKGHESYQVVGDQIIHFDDREEIEAAVRKMQKKSAS